MEYVAYGIFAIVGVIIATVLVVNFVPPVKRWYERLKKG